MKRIIFMMLVILAVGCSKDCVYENDTLCEIKISADLRTRATLSTFEAGDIVGLYAVEYNNNKPQPLQVSGNFLNNERIVFNGSNWESFRKLYWSSNSCDFYGIYPYQDLKTLDNLLFNIMTDQSTAETDDALGGYEASDLMWAKTENVSKSDGTVKLQFNHMMSRLVVKIEKGPSFEGSIPNDIITHIYNTSITAKINYKKGSLEKYALSENKTITMRKIDNQTFDAIVVPQFIERSTPLIEITMGGIAYLLNYSISFMPGCQHTITVILNTSPDQEKIEISIDGEVQSWDS